MDDTLTTEQRLENLDIELEALKDSYVRAVIELRQADEVDASFAHRLELLERRLKDLRTQLAPEDVDKDQLVAYHDALWEIRDLVDAARGRYDLETFDQLLLQIERIRHVVRDAIDEHVSGVRDDVGLVLEELRTWLPLTPQRVIAELADVDRRTLARWANQSGPPSRRLTMVARLVAILRHNWTEDGVIAWFSRPRPDLGGRKPLTLLPDPNYDERLLSAARSGRAQYAS